MARIAMLGGSFNPPHVAHQMAALWALSCGGADQVWLVPCDRHPLGKRLVAFEHRLHMCRLAAAPFAAGQLNVSPVEQELGGESRTYDTLRYLTEQYPGHSFALLIGADILAEKDSWYRFDAIESMVDLLVVGRGGHAPPPGAVVLPEVSSTAIRSRIARGQQVDTLVPGPVLAYIEAHGLYRDASDGAS